ncbi:MAG TPA: hypothetical protein VN870_13670, partial [Streptosporangiaceae bacterium]|nr:hypothetical protein [Streptosporangiaceae bacterium]
MAPHPVRLVTGDGQKHNGPFGELNLAERAVASALGQLVTVLGRTLYHRGPSVFSRAERSGG